MLAGAFSRVGGYDHPSQSYPAACWSAEETFSQWPRPEVKVVSKQKVNAWRGVHSDNGEAQSIAYQQKPISPVKREMSLYECLPKVEVP